MKIQIIAIGKLKKGTFEVLFSQYLMRVKRWKIDIVELPESQAPTVEMRQSEEAEKLQSAIKKGAVVIVLDEKGTHLTSLEVSAFIEQQENDSQSYMSFIIGGADGLHQSIKKQAKKNWAFGCLTWPHQLVRVLLAEQIYRVQTIIEGHPYHRA